MPDPRAAHVIGWQVTYEEVWFKAKIIIRHLNQLSPGFELIYTVDETAECEKKIEPK